MFKSFIGDATQLIKSTVLNYISHNFKIISIKNFK